MDKPESLDKIVDDVFKLESPKIEESRRDDIRSFIGLLVEEDAIQKHLAINATLDKEQEGAIVYILTDVQLIKVDIAEKEIQSSTFPLNTIVNIEKKVIEGDRAQIKIDFQTSFFGLRYVSNNKAISDFFQAVEHSRTKRLKYVEK